jgi:hypothetical protein
MKVEIKNCLGVVILLCLGFILGRITVSLDVKANPQESRVGKYQLVAGTYTNEFPGEEEKIETVFRINTETGEVERWSSAVKFFFGKEEKAMGGDRWIEDRWRLCVERSVTPDSTTAKSSEEILKKGQQMHDIK